MSSPTTSPHQVSSEPDPDTDEWDLDPGEPQELAGINWNDINDEVEAAMNESDDEGDVAPTNALIASEDEWTDESNSVISERASTPTMKRKRRSVTPSEGRGVPVKGGTGSGDEGLRSPLAKRKKLAAGRSGYSRLKEAITADELEPIPESEMAFALPSGLGASEVPEEDGDDGDDEEEEDDFLARELEEEWG